MTEHRNPDEIDWLNEPFDTPRPEYRSAPTTLTVNSETTAEEWRAFFGIDHFDTGPVNADKAMQITAVAAAVNFISDQFATLPLHVFKSTSAGPVKAETDPLFKMMHGVVNENYLTSFEYRKSMAVSRLLNGAAYSYVERDGRGREKGFYPVEFSTIQPKMVDGRLFYEETAKSNGKIKRIEALHMIAFTGSIKMDGVSHYNPIVDHQGLLKLALAVERFTSKVFENNGIPPLQLISQIEASAKAQESAGNAVFDALRRAAAEKKSILPLPAGYKLEAIGFDPAGMQLMELRKWLLLEISRMFNLPPAFLQDLSTGTYSNTEQQSANFVKNTLRPLVKSFEQQLSAKCGLRNTYVKFNFNELVRGDFKTQMEGLRSAVFSGIMTPNEARALLEMPAMEGGDVLFMQGANQPLENLINQPTNDPVSDPVAPQGDQ